MTAISHETTCYFCGEFSEPNPAGLVPERGYRWERHYWADGSGQTVRCVWCMPREEQIAILLLAGWKYMERSDTWMSPTEGATLYNRYYSHNTAFRAAMHAADIERGRYVGSKS